MRVCLLPHGDNTMVCMSVHDVLHCDWMTGVWGGFTLSDFNVLLPRDIRGLLLSAKQTRAIGRWPRKQSHWNLDNILPSYPRWRRSTLCWGARGSRWVLGWVRRRRASSEMESHPSPSCSPRPDLSNFGSKQQQHWITEHSKGDPPMFVSNGRLSPSSLHRQGGHEVQSAAGVNQHVHFLS